MPTVKDENAAVWASVPAGNPRRLLLAALDSFSEHGYHAATTRDISLRANLSPAAVYVHYPSKEDLLYTLSKIGHSDALSTVEAALAGGGKPTERVRRFVSEFSRWHAENHKVARVNQYELGALQPKHAEEIRALRRRFAKLLEAELKRGVDAGECEIKDRKGTTRALLSLGIDVARWYSPKGKMSPGQIGRLYGDLAVRMIEARD